MKNPAAIGSAGVPDALREEAKRHYDHEGMAALLLSISLTNVYNRRNLSTGQVAGERW